MDSVAGRQLDLRLLDRCVLVAQGAGSGKTVFATIGIDLDRREIRGFFLDSARTGGNLGFRMITAAEKLAVQFGILELSIDCPASLTGLLQSCGYRSLRSLQAARQGGSGKTVPSMHRSFPRRQTRYSRQVSSWLFKLGIMGEYGRIHRIGLQQEATKLQSIGCDIYGRNQRMLPAAAQAWLSMSQQAARDGVELQAVSAFRSLAYQAGIVQKKLDKGLAMEDILAVSAAPGFSEHHTGRAIDITSPGSPVLEEEFEKSAAFEWLQAHAAESGFRLSFPRNNRHRVAYEPWHWLWS
jgi:D-alanyl-D-alanine carboxypeptidase